MPKQITPRQTPASAPFRAADHLKSEAEIIAYLKAMLIDGDDRAIPIALRTVSDALERLPCSRKSR